MSRPKGEIKGLRCKRLKEIIEREVVKQNQLSEETGISQQSISAMVQGKANVTETTAEIIVKRFPEYSIEWLLGFSDYKNNAEKFRAVISQAQHEGDLLLTGLSAFAQLANYQIDVTSPMKEIDTVEAALKMIVGGYTISHDGVSIKLSLEEMNAFENEVCDFVELQLKHLFKRKGGQ